jgi:hypothetical protein
MHRGDAAAGPDRLAQLGRRRVGLIGDRLAEPLQAVGVEGGTLAASMRRGLD